MRKDIEDILVKYIPSSYTCEYCKNEVNVLIDWDKMVDELEKLLTDGKVQIADVIINNVLTVPYLRQPNKHEDYLERGK